MKAIKEMSYGEILALNKKYEQAVRDRLLASFEFLLCEYDEYDQYGCDVLIEQEDCYGNKFHSLPTIVGMWYEAGDIYFQLDTEEIKTFSELTTTELLIIANDIELL